VVRPEYTTLQLLLTCMNAESQTLLVRAYMDRLVALHVQQQRWLSLEEMRRVSQGFGLNKGDIVLVSVIPSRQFFERSSIFSQTFAWRGLLICVYAHLLSEMVLVEAD
jgi:hypothetical protein